MQIYTYCVSLLINRNSEPLSTEAEELLSSEYSLRCLLFRHSKVVVNIELNNFRWKLT